MESNPFDSLGNGGAKIGCQHSWIG
jgi:hypothetical protein